MFMVNKDEYIYKDPIEFRPYIFTEQHVLSFRHNDGHRLTVMLKTSCIS